MLSVVVYVAILALRRQTQVHSLARQPSLTGYLQAKGRLYLQEGTVFLRMTPEVVL